MKKRTTHVSAKDWIIDGHHRMLASKRIDLPVQEAKVGPVGIPMLLWCPGCGERHIDAGEWTKRVHHTHACQSCGMVWRPAIEPTVGVMFLPGFKNEEP